MSEHVCVYCGQPASHQFKNGKWCCSKYMSQCPANKSRIIEKTKDLWKIRKDNKTNSTTSKLSDFGLKTSHELEQEINILEFDGTHCQYGCGLEAKYILKNGRHCCSEFITQCPKIRERNSSGVFLAYQEGRLNAIENYKNKCQESKDRMAWSRGKILTNPEEFVNKKEIDIDTLKKMCDQKLIDLQYKCSCCGCDGTWMGKPIKLEIHHIDGNHYNNDIKNLTYLCPNCHSQTQSYRNRGTSRWLNDIEIKKFLEENLPKYDNNINKLLQYNKVKNQSHVYRKYFELYHNLNLS